MAKYFPFILFLVGHFPSFSQIEEKDSLWKIVEKNNIDTASFEALRLLVMDHWEHDPAKAIELGKNAYSIASILQDKTRSATAFQLIGVGFDYQNNLDSCLNYLNKSIALYKSLKRVDKESHVVSDVALAWYLRGHYEAALKNHLKALELRQQFGDTKFLAISYNNLGLVYRSKKDYQKAIEYYKKSLKIKQDTKDEAGLLNTFMNIGSAYQKNMQYDSAYFYASKSLALSLNLKSERDEVASKGNMAAAMINLNKVEEVLPILKEVEQRALKLNESKILLTTYESLGDLYRLKSNYNLAIKNYQKGLKIATVNNRLEAKELYNRKLSKTFANMGNYRLALDHQNNSRAIADTLLNQENTRQLNEMTTIYEASEKEKRITQLNAENKLANAASEKKKQQNVFLILVSLLMLCLTAFAFYAYSINKRKNIQLSEQNKVIESSLVEKNYLMREIHHRVKNNLQLVSSLLNLQSHFIKDVSAQEALKEGRNRVYSMSLIHQCLYKDDNLTIINAQDYLSQLVENIFTSYNIDDVRVKLEKDIDPIKLDVDAIIPIGLMVNELITNSIKYAFPDNTNGLIKFVFKEENSKFKLSIWDNGRGLPDNFVLENQITFGLKMVQTFLKKLNGTMQIYNEDGTKVDILFDKTTS